MPGHEDGGVGDSTETRAPEEVVERVVRYVGTADERILTQDDLMQAGAKHIKRQFIWDRHNGFKVSLSELQAHLPEDVFHKAIEPDSGLVVAEA